MWKVVSDLQDRIEVRIDAPAEAADCDAMSRGDQDAIAVEVSIDHEAAPGDVVPALARLLIDMARKRRPELFSPSP